jgi:hypothetical protein
VTDSSRHQSSTYAGYEGPPTAPTPTGASEDASMMDKASESTEAGKQAVSDVAQTAAGQAKEVAAEAQNQAKKVVSDARDQLRSHAGDQHQNAVTNLRALGEELRSMASNGDQSGMASDLVGRRIGWAAGSPRICSRSCAAWPGSGRARSWSVRWRPAWSQGG